MNSIYKRYFIITLIGLLLCLGMVINKQTVNVLSAVDKTNEYVRANGTLDGLRCKGLSTVVIDGDSMHYYADLNEPIHTDEGKKTLPDFYYTAMRVNYGIGSYGIGSNIWLLLALMTVVFYIYERGSSTADFCASLPVRRRSMFLAKLAGLLVIVLAAEGARLWTVMQYNIRLDDCIQTLKILGMDSKYIAENVISIDTGIRVNNMLSIALSASVLLLLAELTGKAYLPPCIFVLAVLAVAGSLAGLKGFIKNYSGFIPDKGVVIGIREIKHGINTSQRGIVILLVLFAVSALWGLFISGRGDISRRDSIFRFAWAEKLALVCISVCAALCSYYILSLMNLNYRLNMAAALCAMAFAGVVALFVSKRIILLLGR